MVVEMCGTGSVEPVLVVGVEASALALVIGIGLQPESLILAQNERWRHA
jgi:hypothetical protein